MGVQRMLAKFVDLSQDLSNCRLPTSPGWLAATHTWAAAMQNLCRIHEPTRDMGAAERQQVLRGALLVAVKALWLNCIVGKCLKPGLQAYQVRVATVGRFTNIFSLQDRPLG